MLVYINENKLSLDDIDMAYTTLDRKYAGKTLPPWIVSDKSVLSYRRTSWLT